MKINDIVVESWNPDKEYPDTEQGAIECFTDISEYKPTEVTKVYPDPYTSYVWAVHTNTKRYGPQKHVVWINEKDFATDDRSGEEDFRVNESTTAGSIATVAAPMTTQSRNASIYGGKKGGNLLTGKKTNKKYANSAVVKESKMKELATDIRDMDNGNFKKKYGNTKEHFKASLGDPHSNKNVQENMDHQTKKQLLRYADAFRFLEVLEKAGVKVLEVRPGGEQAARFLVDINGRQHLLTMNKLSALSEAMLEEDDVIIVPGQGRKLKSGFIPHGESRVDHEVEMAKSDLFSAAKNAKQVYEMIKDVSEDEGLEGWVQEKIIKANDYLNSVREYLEGKKVQEMTGGVIAGGGVGESINSTENKFYVRPKNIIGAKGKYLVHSIDRNALDNGWEVRVGSAGNNGFDILDTDYKDHTFYDIDGKPMYVTTVTKKLNAGGGVSEAKKQKLAWAAKTVVRNKDGSYTSHNIGWDSPGDQALVASNENGEAIITWDDNSKEYILVVNGKQHPVPGPHKYPTQAKELGAKLLAGVNEESKGLWANIHAKRERIQKGSGERMRKPGSKGAPSAQDFKDASK